MRRTVPAHVLTVVLALVVSGATVWAQRGGPRPPAGASSVQQITVHGKSLEGNLEGDSPDREVAVYLPPTYATDQARRYAVVYLLHGYTGKHDTFTTRLATVQESADRLAAQQGFTEFIVVMPNAFTLHKGSMYSASPTTGDWERFIADDLVGYVDSHYRTLPTRMSRGLAGHSMGGYGALRVGMKRGDVFGSLYLMSSCCLGANRAPRPEAFAAAEAIKTREQADEASRTPGFGPSVMLAQAAAWSPNPANPPLFFDLPVKDGVVRPEIVAKWVANAPLEMLPQYEAALKGYYAIAIDIGTKDPLLASNQQLNKRLASMRVPHRYEEYDGDHTNRVKERLERNVLPFFARNLTAPLNPTNPSVR
jgi:enterochelin esterase-like enzyme